MRLALTATTGCLLAVLSGLALALPKNLNQAESAVNVDPSVELEGVIVGSLPSTSIALVRKHGVCRPRSVGVGETVYGMTLIEVSEEEAVFEWNGSYLRLLLDGGRTVQSAQQADFDVPTGGESVDSTVDPRNDEGSERATKPADEWLVRKLERGTTEARLEKELPVILAETGITPRYTDKKPQGLEIQHLPDGTVLSELGLLPGDILLSVNDVSLESLNSLNGLLPCFRAEDEVLVIVERRGRILNFAYEINP